MAYDHEHNQSRSIRHRIKSSICASFCFTSNHFELATSSGDGDGGFHRKRLVSRCTTFFSKIGAKSSSRATNTSKFGYDALSYALNFDDTSALGNFSSTLPLSAPSKTPPLSAAT